MFKYDEDMDIESLKNSIREELKQELINELVLKKKENRVSIVYKPLCPHKVFVTKSQKILNQNDIYTSNECRMALNYLIKNTLGIKSMPKLTKEQIPIALEITKDFCQAIKNCREKYTHENKDDDIYQKRDKHGLWVWKSR